MRFRTLVASCTFVLAVLASNHAADASAILFTDRAAFELAAMPNLNPLRTTDIVVIGGGQFCCNLWRHPARVHGHRRTRYFFVDR